MKELSKTFCVYPWVHQMIETDGDVKLCCIAETPTKKETGKHMNINKNKLSELWNDPYMQDIRRRMLEGTEVRDCGQCYRKERDGERRLKERDGESRVLVDQCKVGWINKAVRKVYWIDIYWTVYNMDIGRCNGHCRGL